MKIEYYVNKDGKCEYSYLIRKRIEELKSNECDTEARTVSELRDKIGGGLVSKMYVNDRSGNRYHIGYVIGRYWCTAYMPVRILQ